MMKKYTVLLCVLLVMVMGIFPKQGQAVTFEDTPRSTWLWDTTEIVNNSDEILTFLVDKKVKVVYLQVNPTVSIEAYKAFINRATSNQIQIHALDGAPDWVAPKGITHQRSFFTWVEGYQAEALETERFTGIHLDVEPYLYSGWTSNYKKTVLSYQNLLSEAVLEAEQLNLPIAFDIPFWFDEKNYNNTFGKGNLASWVIQKAGHVTIMAYRDQALGQNGINELVQNEMNEARKYNTQVTIAVETTPSSEATYVTFYEEGLEHMEQQLRIVRDQYADYSSFSGFAVHSIAGWMNMR
ncbi:amidase [Cytobacillus suaedae]|nr:amidase [Cytobacillus suaedae]